MALFYITGTPGTGKTTIQKELSRLGYEAYDLDDRRFGGPCNKATNKPVDMPPIEERTPEWFDAHEWRVSRPAMETLKTDSVGKIVFVCGTATTENIIWDLFDKVLYLNVDEATLCDRIANREGNDFGKTDHELQRILVRYREAQESLKNLDVTLIDTTGSVDATIKSILSATS